MEIRIVLKGTFHCFICSPLLLYCEKLSGYRGEKIFSANISPANIRRSFYTCHPEVNNALPPVMDLMVT